MPEAQLTKAFEKWWPELETVLKGAAEELAKPASGTQPSARPDRELLEELLELTRGIVRQTRTVTVLGASGIAGPSGAISLSGVGRAVMIPGQGTFLVEGASDAEKLAALADALRAPRKSDSSGDS